MFTPQRDHRHFDFPRIGSDEPHAADAHGVAVAGRPRSVSYVPCNAVTIPYRIERKWLTGITNLRGFVNLRTSYRYEREISAGEPLPQSLRAGQIVDIYSHFEGEVRKASRFAVVPYAIARRSAAAYYPETNVLVPVRRRGAQGISFRYWWFVVRRKYLPADVEPVIYSGIVKWRPSEYSIRSRAKS